MPFLGGGGGGGGCQFHLITQPPFSLVICCFPSVYSSSPPIPRQCLSLLVISLSSIIFLPFVFATVLHKPIILIASLVPSLLPLSVPAINRIACSTAVIGGPCPSDVTQFFVCVSSSVTNGATLPRSGFALFLYQPRRSRELFCGTVCLFWCFVAIQNGLEIV